MNQVSKIKKLSTLSYFDKNTLSQFVDLSDNSLYANINRWLRSDILVSLKKGLYVTSEFLKSQNNRLFYMEFIANKLREPSYLSMEYVLQKNNMLAESVYGLTSVTLKSKRTYQNKLGVFTYRNIKDELFDGYTLQDKDGFTIKMATKAKALFDYFYYKLWKVKEIDTALIKNFRLNYDEWTPADFNEFSQYCHRVQIKKMMDLIPIIKKMR